MDIQLRWDRICEKQRGTDEIRDRLAHYLRRLRLYTRKKDMGLFDTSDVMRAVAQAEIGVIKAQIETLKWVLRE